MRTHYTWRSGGICDWHWRKPGRKQRISRWVCNVWSSTTKLSSCRTKYCCSRFRFVLIRFYSCQTIGNFFSRYRMIAKAFIAFWNSDYSSVDFFCKAKILKLMPWVISFFHEFNAINFWLMIAFFTFCGNLHMASLYRVQGWAVYCLD